MVQCDPKIIINFKTYIQGMGQQAVRLARLAESISNDYDIYIGIAPQFTDLNSVVQEVDIPVFDQHIDVYEPGSHTGHVLPEAVAAIEVREKIDLNNAVEIIQRIPKAGVDEEADWIYGVATWVGVDPNTDYFKLFAEGFSNGYKVITVDDESVVLRKTVEVKYWRPGDEFQQRDNEIRRNPEDPRPEWLYRPSGIASQQ